MGFIGIANAYAMRSVLSVAITEMVEDIHKTAIDPNGCPGPVNMKNTTNPVSLIGKNGFNKRCDIFNLKINFNKFKFKFYGRKVHILIRIKRCVVLIVV